MMITFSGVWGVLDDRHRQGEPWTFGGLESGGELYVKIDTSWWIDTSASLDLL